MDGFTYTNIFDTKGIEYLIIIAFLLLIIPVWVFMNKPVSIKSKIKEKLNVLSESILHIPQGFYFSNFHTWAFLESNGLARIGADDLLLHITGDVQLETVKQQGDRVRKGEIIARIKNSGKQLNLASPVSGEVMRTNRLPFFGNQDPFVKGWICDIKPMNWRQESEACYLAEDASKWMKNELARFREFILDAGIATGTGQNINPVLQEGGELPDHTLAMMSEAVWQEFQNGFLNP